jgi:outer membrane receptor protein involved in Fe transport
VPVHRGSMTVAYTNPRILDIAVSALMFGRQFNEDTNLGTVPGEDEAGLPAYGVIELTVLRNISRNLDVFVGVQNLFDTEYYVGLVPTTIGSPRLVNAGIRVGWAAR